MRIGAHNAMTAFRPLRWWAWAALPVWRCQRRKPATLAADPELHVKAFDIRFARFMGTQPDGTPRWLSAHGLVTINADPVAEIATLVHTVPRLIIRVILEKGDEADQKAFAWTCRWLERRHPSVMFIGGNYKPTWKQLYAFASDTIHDNIDQYVGSMCCGPWHSRLLGKLFPMLWACRHNPRLLSGAMSDTSSRICLFDRL